MPVRSCSDIIIDFLKLLLVFIKCSVLCANIPVGENHIVCISQLWTIVDTQSGFKLLIPVRDNLIAEQCTATFNPHMVPTMGVTECCYGIKSCISYTHSQASSFDTSCS